MYLFDQLYIVFSERYAPTACPILLYPLSPPLPLLQIDTRVAATYRRLKVKLVRHDGRRCNTTCE